jgi:hypothetical protein
MIPSLLVLPYLPLQELELPAEVTSPQRQNLQHIQEHQQELPRFSLLHHRVISKNHHCLLRWKATSSELEQAVVVPVVFQPVRNHPLWMKKMTMMKIAMSLIDLLHRTREEKEQEQERSQDQSLNEAQPLQAWLPRRHPPSKHHRLE